MYKTIMVPLDGSKRAEAILPHVQELAVRGAARVIILYVEEPFVLLDRDEIIDMEQYWRERSREREEIEAYATGLIRDFKDKNISAKLLIGQGPVVKCIIETASREGADLVAMASHGRGAIQRTFYGSVAAGVLQRIDRPLLLIRSRS